MHSNEKSLRFRSFSKHPVSEGTGYVTQLSVHFNLLNILVNLPTPHLKCMICLLVQVSLFQISSPFEGSRHLVTGVLGQEQSCVWGFSLEPSGTAGGGSQLEWAAGRLTLSFVDFFSAQGDIPLPHITLSLKSFLILFHNPASLVEQNFSTPS